jgi:hypothetical protein
MITRQRCQVSVQAGLAPRRETSELTLSCCMVMPMPGCAWNETAERRAVNETWLNEIWLNDTWLKANQSEADECDTAKRHGHANGCNGVKQNPQKTFWHREPRHHEINATSEISCFGGHADTVLPSLQRNSLVKLDVAAAG